MKSSATVRTTWIMPWALVLGVLALACASGPRLRYKHEFSLSPDKAHHAGLATALLIPIDYTNPEVVRGLDRANDRIAEQIQAHLESKGIAVERIESAAFKQVADAAYRRVLQERKSGASGTVSSEVTFGDLVPQILAELDRSTDLVVAANVVMRVAEYKGTRSIFWDGVTRRENVHDSTMTGHVRGASLHVSVFTKEGEQVFRGYGGLEQVFRLDRAARKYVQREDLLDDPRNIKEGVCVAFYPYFGMQEFCAR